MSDEVSHFAVPLSELVRVPGNSQVAPVQPRYGRPALMAFCDDREQCRTMPSEAHDLYEVEQSSPPAVRASSVSVAATYSIGVVHGRKRTGADEAVPLPLAEAAGAWTRGDMGSEGAA